MEICLEKGAKISFYFETIYVKSFLASNLCIMSQFWNCAIYYERNRFLFYISSHHLCSSSCYSPAISSSVSRRVRTSSLSTSTPRTSPSPPPWPGSSSVWRPWSTRTGRLQVRWEGAVEESNNTNCQVWPSLQQDPSPTTWCTTTFQLAYCVSWACWAWSYL